MERGSVLILTLVAVLVLSLLVTGLLTVGTTEMYTTQNYHMNRLSHFHGLQGLESVRNLVQISEDPPSIVLADNTIQEDGVSKRFYLGSILDVQDGQPAAIKIFEGFPPPPMLGMSMGTNTGIVPVIWDVKITSKIKQGQNQTFTEIVSGVYTIMKEY